MVGHELVTAAAVWPHSMSVRGILDIPVAGWTGRTGTALHGRKVD